MKVEQKPIEEPKKISEEPRKIEEPHKEADSQAKPETQQTHAKAGNFVEILCFSSTLMGNADTQVCPLGVT